MVVAVEPDREDTFDNVSGALVYARCGRVRLHINTGMAESCASGISAALNKTMGP